MPAQAYAYKNPEVFDEDAENESAQCDHDAEWTLDVIAELSEWNDTPF